MPSIDADIVVLGGGPAGSILALRLAQIGHAVTLVERAAFPRAQVGESLGPAATHMLELVGLREKIEAAGFFRPRTAFVRWENEETEVKDFGAAPGYQVDRGRFDHILLGAAADAGVRVLQPATARRPHRGSDGGWIIPLCRDGRDVVLTASYCADACGRRSPLGGHRARLLPRTLALYAYWTGTNLGGCETRVEAGEAQWYWGAPLPDGTVNAAVFLDPRRWAGLSRASIEEFYLSLVARSALLRGCLNGTIVGGVKVRDATSSLADPVVGDDFVRVGDAALAIDPLSSQGVQTAMLTALQAAAVVNTTLQRPADTAYAVEFYRAGQKQRAEQFQRLSANFYAARARRTAEEFWRERAAGAAPDTSESRGEPLPLGTRLRLAADAKLTHRPVLSGDFIAVEEVLVHPRLDGPCAFVTGVRLAPLLRQLGGGQSVADILQAWANHLPPQAVEAVLSWLWEAEVISAVGDRRGNAREMR
jgi:flavin-dependent dehydrogenase